MTKKTTEEKTSTKFETVDVVMAKMQMSLKAPKDLNCGRYSYRKAEDILQKVKEVLAGEEYPDAYLLTNVDILEKASRTFVKVTATLNSCNSKIEAVGYAELEVSKKGMDLAQLTGAATTYAKKYALCNLFSIDDSSDDPDTKNNSSDNKKNIKKLAKISTEDRKEAVNTEKTFQQVKKNIEDSLSLEILKNVWGKNKIFLSHLKSNDPFKYKILSDAKEFVKNQISVIDNQSNNELFDDNI